MPTHHQRRKREAVPLHEWASPENQGKVLTRGEALSLFESFRDRLREDAWHRRLWRWLTRPALEGGR